MFDVGDCDLGLGFFRLGNLVIVLFFMVFILIQKFRFVPC